MSKLNKRGFSLLELLIALTILSCGLTVILQAISLVARNARFSVEWVDSVLWAQDRLAEAEFSARQNRLLVGNSTIQIRDSMESRVSVSPLAEESLPTAKLYKMDLYISWKSFRKVRENYFSTALLEHSESKT